ncbi:hypothetical protein [Cupriavidus sp. MP-37]|uniref:hypothetical protein n=1 Tax=Cupriavidus sp. MP-37 TaxID=2884455 RepID=UPI001D0B83B9|nr:hypothetical protein [Cupriavidus sp. MP-37]UDM52011.1 hypothetical protein LIN44_22495 [Cupriavidus sp. MP-37]
MNADGKEQDSCLARLGPSRILPRGVKKEDYTYQYQARFADDLSVLSEAPAVFTDLLGLIQANDKNHYDAMMKII